MIPMPHHDYDIAAANQAKSGRMSDETHQGTTISPLHPASSRSHQALKVNKNAQRQTDAVKAFFDDQLGTVAGALPVNIAMDVATGAILWLGVFAATPTLLVVKDMVFEATMLESAAVDLTPVGVAMLVEAD